MNSVLVQTCSISSPQFAFCPIPFNLADPSSRFVYSKLFISFVKDSGVMSPIQPYSH